MGYKQPRHDDYRYLDPCQSPEATRPTPANPSPPIGHVQRLQNIANSSPSFHFAHFSHFYIPPHPPQLSSSTVPNRQKPHHRRRCLATDQSAAPPRLHGHPPVPRCLPPTPCLSSSVLPPPWPLLPSMLPSKWLPRRPPHKAPGYLARWPAPPRTYDHAHAPGKESDPEQARQGRASSPQVSAPWLAPNKHDSLSRMPMRD